MFHVPGFIDGRFLAQGDQAFSIYKTFREFPFGKSELHLSQVPFEGAEEDLAA